MPFETDVDVGAFALERNTQVKQARGLRVDIDGLAAFRRDVKTMDKTVQRQVNKALREAMDPVTRQAAALAPRQSGRLARSIRPFARGNAVGVRSPLPYANLIHWGGSTGRGHMPGVEWSGSIFVRESLFISRAIERNEREILDRVGDVIETDWQRGGAFGRSGRR